MKTPISYYGGKQNLVKSILKLIPPHQQYVEPFFGGGAVFFAKHKSNSEVINDLNSYVVNFYRVLQTRFDDLKVMITGTLHSEYDYKKSMAILKEEMKDPLEYAWAFWVQSVLCFSNKIFAGFAFGNDDKCANVTNNKKKAFSEYFFRRIEKTEIFNRDALNVMKLKDDKDTFFYLDPPYVSSNCGHYAGYTMDQFNNLLDFCSTMKGKFLMNSYPEDSLIDFRDKFEWSIKDETGFVYVTGKRIDKKLKTECLTYNYSLNGAQKTMF